MFDVYFKITEACCSHHKIGSHSNRISANVSILGITNCIWNVYNQNCNMYIIRLQIVLMSNLQELMKSITASPANQINSTYNSPDWAPYVNLCALKVLSYGTQFVIMMMFFVLLVHSNHIWKGIRQLVYYQFNDERFHSLPFWNNGRISY